jgi:hypothetical protein
MSYHDRMRIFHDEDVWDSVVKPLFSEFQNNTCILSPEDDKTKKMLEIHKIVKGCLVYEVPYDIAKLFDDDTSYRSQIKVNLYNAMLKVYRYNKNNPNAEKRKHVDRTFENLWK